MEILLLPLKQKYTYLQTATRVSNDFMLTTVKCEYNLRNKINKTKRFTLKLYVLFK